MSETGLTIEYIYEKLIEAQQYYAELVDKQYIDLQNNTEVNQDLESDIFWIYNLNEGLYYRLSRNILDDTTIELYKKLQRRIGVGTSTQIVFNPYFTDISNKYIIGIGIDLSLYALDSTVVHKANTETIIGLKTFTQSPLIPVATTANQAVNLGQLSTVATTGSYNDLLNKPAIYSFTGTSLQYTKGDGTYATLNTTAVPEGTRLYYTDARVQSFGDTRYGRLAVDNTWAGKQTYTDGSTYSLSLGQPDGGGNIITTSSPINIGGIYLNAGNIEFANGAHIAPNNFFLKETGAVYSAFQFGVDSDSTDLNFYYNASSNLFDNLNYSIYTRLLYWSSSFTTAGLDNYFTDLSGSYTSRSKIDKGYADAHYAPVSGGSYVTSLQDNTVNGVTVTWTNRTTTPVPTISIQDAGANDITKGIAAFTASDFNEVLGLISIDYTNGQSASGSTKGFLTPTDWNTFNGKQSALSGTGFVKISGTAISYDNTSYLSLAGGTLVGDVQQTISPVNGNSLITKSYIDNLITGLTWKKEVRAATVSNITLSGTQTIDGIALIANDRILVKNQTTQNQNGIYVVASGSWTRALDADTTDEIVGATVMVRLGTINKDTQWTNTNSNEPVIGTDDITFAQISGAGTYTNGTGISLSSNVFSLDLTYTDARYAKLSGANFSGKIGVNGSVPTGGVALAINGDVAGNGIGGFGNSVETPIVKITGTGGAGYMNIAVNAGALIPTPASGFMNYTAATNGFLMKNPAGFTLSVTTTNLTNNRVLQAPNQAGLIMTNPLSTTGDMLYANATSSVGDNLSRLPIGSTGDVLTVSGGTPNWSSIATILGYTPANGANYVLKSGDTMTGNLGIGFSPGRPLDVAKAGANISGDLYFNAAFYQDHTNYKGVELGYRTGTQTGVISAASAGAPSNLELSVFDGSDFLKKVDVSSTGITVTGIVNSTSNIIANGVLASRTSVEINKDGSNSVTVGAYITLYNTAADRAMLQQLNASNGLDYYALSGSGFSKIGTLSQSGDLSLAGTGTFGGAIGTVNNAESPIYVDATSNAGYYSFKKNGVDKWYMLMERNTPAYGMAANDWGLIRNGGNTPDFYVKNSNGDAVFNHNLTASNFSGSSSGTNTGDETTTRINALYGYTPANGANYLPLTGGAVSGLVSIIHSSSIGLQVKNSLASGFIGNLIYGIATQGDSASYNLIRLNNNLNDIKFGVNGLGDTYMSGAVTTGAPPGDVAQAWKFGSVQSATMFPTTNVLAVAVNGTTYYIPLMTP